VQRWRPSALDDEPQHEGYLPEEPTKEEERFHRSQKARAMGRRSFCAGRRKRKRDFIVTKNVSDGAEVSLRERTASSRKTIRDAKGAQERSGKKKSARSVRNDGWARAVMSELKLRPPKWSLIRGRR
jgi:hypothetical protein